MPGNRRLSRTYVRSFQKEDLRDKDFRYSDIRGVDFSGASLIGADFSYACAGIRLRSMIGMIIGALLLAFVSGLVVGFVGSAGPFFANLSATDYVFLQQRVLPWVAVSLLGLLMFILFWRGLGTTLAIFAVSSLFLLSLIAILFPSEDVVATAILIMLTIGAGIAGVFVFSFASALLLGITRTRLAWVALVVAIAGTIPGIAEGVFAGITQPGRSFQDASISSLLLAGVVTLLLLSASVYVSQRAMSGDHRYALIRALVIGFLSTLGTSFRRADLSDVDFTGALLANTDLREGVLVRTNFSQAQYLNRARTEGTYLAHPLVTQLVTSRDGRKGNFANLRLQGINLNKANLTEANFINANLSQATLQAADMSHAKLAHTQLHDADLSGACLTGANIEDWGISTKTQLGGIQCDYVYTRLPTDLEPDAWRKPDNRSETFREGDFTDFITPFIKTLDLYRQQNIDPRTIGRAYKTLDLFHHEGIDPMVSAIALTKLAERHPAAGIELVALEGRGKDKIRVQAAVTPGADQSALSAEYDAIYAQIKLLSQEHLSALAVKIAEKDDRIRSLEEMVTTALRSEKFYVETYINLGGPIMTSIKSLFLAANPSGTERLSLDREIREITTKIRASDYRDAIQLISAWAVRPDDLLQTLNEHKPQIVHFSGHGTASGEIVLVDDSGAPKPVSATALRALFTTLKENIKLVILNACYAEIQARAITEVIDCAIGMNAAISDDATILFIASFYRALGFGLSIQQAFEQGVIAIMLEGISEENTPQLLVRAGVHPESIVLVQPLSVSGTLQGNHLGTTTE